MPNTAESHIGFGDLDELLLAHATTIYKSQGSQYPAVVAGNATALAQNLEGWRLALSDGTEHCARFVVDATGNAAALARQCLLPSISIDRLVGCCLCVGSGTDGTEGLLIESFPEGWWYTAALPNGERIVACMTDADRVRPLQLSRIDHFVDLLSRTSHVRRVAEINGALGRPTIAGEFPIF